MASSLVSPVAVHRDRAERVGSAERRAVRRGSSDPRRWRRRGHSRWRSAGCPCCTGVASTIPIRQPRSPASAAQWTVEPPAEAQRRERKQARRRRDAGRRTPDRSRRTGSLARRRAGWRRVTAQAACERRRCAGWASVSSNRSARNRNVSRKPRGRRTSSSSTSSQSAVSSGIAREQLVEVLELAAAADRGLIEPHVVAGARTARVARPRSGSGDPHGRRRGPAPGAAEARGRHGAAGAAAAVDQARRVVADVGKHGSRRAANAADLSAGSRQEVVGHRAPAARCGRLSAPRCARAGGDTASWRANAPRKRGL